MCTLGTLRAWQQLPTACSGIRVSASFHHVPDPRPQSSVGSSYKWTALNLDPRVGTWDKETSLYSERLSTEGKPTRQPRKTTHVRRKTEADNDRHWQTRHWPVPPPCGAAARANRRKIPAWLCVSGCPVWVSAVGAPQAPLWAWPCPVACMRAVVWSHALALPRPA